MKFKFILLIGVLAILSVLGFSTNSEVSAMPNQIALRAQIAQLKSNSTTSSTSFMMQNFNESSTEEVLDQLSVVADNSNYLSFAPLDESNDVLHKIATAREILEGISFNEWIATFAQGDDSSKLVKSRKTTFANKEAVWSHYLVDLHGEFKLATLYVNFGDTLLSFGAYGHIDRGFEELEGKIERVIDEL